MLHISIGGLFGVRKFSPASGCRNGHVADFYWGPLWRAQFSKTVSSTISCKFLQGSVWHLVGALEVQTFRALHQRWQILCTLQIFIGGLFFANNVHLDSCRKATWQEGCASMLVQNEFGGFRFMKQVH